MGHGRLQPIFHRHQQLVDAIMQFPRYPAAFFFLMLHGLVAQLFQILVRQAMFVHIKQNPRRHHNTD